MSFPRPIQWFHSHAVIIWPVRTFNFRFQIVPNELSFCPFFLMVASFLPTVLYTNERENFKGKA